MKWLVISGLGLVCSLYCILRQHIQYDICRPMITHVARNTGGPLTIVEIGVFWGTNTLRMFRRLAVKKAYLVDPYIKYDGYTEKKRLMFLLPSSFKPVLWLLRKYADRVIPLQKTSREAAAFIPDDVDVVYIDGNHDYHFVREDIETYYPKVKPGGYIGGHDIAGKTAGANIHRAVTEFAEKNNLSVHIQEPDWWIVKPL